MNLLTISDLTENQILEIFDLADQLSKDSEQYLKGKTFVLFFPVSSIRTRITFLKGLKDLGAECINFSPETLDKREELCDVIGYIENFADGVIVRHRDISKLEILAKNSKIPIINAMTQFNHPCEILSDLYSIKNLKGNYRNLVYTFVGEAGNISRSWMHVAKVMNLKFNHVCVEGNQFKDNDINYNFTTKLEPLLKITDVVLTDSLPKELINDEYINKYQITLERMKLTKKGSILNPCPPFFRGEEVSEDVIKSDYFVGYQFKKNLIYLQLALILYASSIKN